MVMDIPMMLMTLLKPLLKYLVQLMFGALENLMKNMKLLKQRKNKRHLQQYLDILQFSHTLMLFYQEFFIVVVNILKITIIMQNNLLKQLFGQLKKLNQVESYGLMIVVAQEIQILFGHQNTYFTVNTQQELLLVEQMQK